MKKQLLSLLLLLVIFGGDCLAQNNSNCQTAMSSYAFQQKSRAIGRATSESNKLQLAKQLVQNNCVSVPQVKELCGMFLEDLDRLEFAKLAYKKTVHQDEFYDVYDSFAYFSTVFRLHDFILEEKTGSPHHGGGGGNGGTISFPNYNYPNPLNYSGAKFCSSPLQDIDFMNFAQQVKSNRNDNSKLTASLQIANSHCLSTAQMMKLSSILSEEQTKLNFLKQAYDAVYDVRNFHSASQVLQSSYNQQDFQRFIQSKNNGGGGSNPNYGCRIDNAEFATIKNQIERQNFNSSKINLAKSLLRNKGKCFVVSQVREILSIFSFENSKLEIAKFAYDFTNDTQNYAQLGVLLQYSSSKRDFEQFLESK
ncbi:MAG: hypothetical protein ACJAWV_000417 [Flammeovirgaceae bacterium]|jgi:hypothetical protein